MKKTYIEPFIEMDCMDSEQTLCASNDITSSGIEGISYGGVDEEGTLDPASRRHSIWGDEYEE